MFKKWNAQNIFQRGQQFIGIKPNQAVDLMKGGTTSESINLRKAVLKQKSGPEFHSSHPYESQRSRVRRKSWSNTIS